VHSVEVQFCRWRPPDRVGQRLPGNSFPDVALREVTPMLRVLVVGDEPDTTDSMHVLLETWGFVVLTASAGPATVKVSTTFRPDAVLLDMGLPWKEAFAAVRQIRQLGGRQPIILCISGYRQDEYRRQAFEAGCDHFFFKPVDPDELKAFLRT